MSRAKSSFSAGILNTIEEVRSRSAKVTCFTVENGPPSRPPRNWQHYRGFDHLGRWGPQSGRPGHRPPGKIRHFRNDRCSFPGREAGSACATHHSVEESTSRMAAGTVIYGISGDAVFRIRNTIEETTPRVAEMTCFTVNIYRNSQHYRESDVPHRQSDVFYRQSSGPCRTPLRKRQHYRGFGHLGRWGP